MGISGWFGLEAIAYSLNYTIIMDSCQLSEIEAFSAFAHAQSQAITDKFRISVRKVGLPLPLH